MKHIQKNVGDVPKALYPRVVPASGNSSTIRWGVTNSAKRRSGASWCRRKRFTAEASGMVGFEAPENGGFFGEKCAGW